MTIFVLEFCSGGRISRLVKKAMIYLGLFDVEILFRSAIIRIKEYGELVCFCNEYNKVIVRLADMSGSHTQ